ncbi:MAG: hypothetical protein R3217_09740 [Gammaproteobacteria bacterium]|nr:hypothetical protein [Gammaproteobacteria bacterium]
MIKAKQGSHLLIGWIVMLLLGGVASWVLHDKGLLLEFQERGFDMIRKRDTMPALVGGFFVLFYFFMLVKLFLDTVSVFRFGLGRYHPDPIAGSIGGQLGGTILMRYSPRAGDAPLVTVTCYRRYVRRRNNKSESAVERVWSDQVRPEATGHLGGMSFRFTFDLPDDLMPTGKSGKDHFYWEVALRIDRPGRDVVRSFDLKVTKDDVPRMASSPVRQALVAAASSASSFPGISIDSTPASIEVRTRRGRALGMNLFLLVFALLCLGVFFGLGIGVVAENWRDLFSAEGSVFRKAFALMFVLVPGFMALVFGLIGLLLSFVAISGLLNKRSFRFDGRTFVTRNLSREKTIALDEVQGIELSESSSMGADAWYDVKLVLHDGRRQDIVENIPGKAAAREITSQLERLSGLRVESLGRGERLKRKALRFGLRRAGKHRDSA